MNKSESKRIAAECKQRFPATAAQLGDLAQVCQNLNFARVMACIKNYSTHPQNHAQFEWLGHLCELIRADFARAQESQKRNAIEKIIHAIRRRARYELGISRYQSMPDDLVIVDHFATLIESLADQTDSYPIRLYVQRMTRVALEEIGTPHQQAAEMASNVSGIPLPELRRAVNDSICDESMQSVVAEALLRF